MVLTAMTMTTTMATGTLTMDRLISISDPQREEEAKEVKEAEGPSTMTTLPPLLVATITLMDHLRRTLTMDHLRLILISDHQREEEVKEVKEVEGPITMTTLLVATGTLTDHLHRTLTMDQLRLTLIMEHPKEEAAREVARELSPTTMITQDLDQRPIVTVIKNASQEVAMVDMVTTVATMLDTAVAAREAAREPARDLVGTVAVSG